jgi:hypothetical protein
MSIIAMPQRERIPLDANGYPHGHKSAMEKVLTDFMDMVNDLPESVYFLNRTDAEWIAEQLIRTYLLNVPRER